MSEQFSETMLAVEKRLFDELTGLGSDSATVAALSTIMSVSLINLSVVLAIFSKMARKEDSPTLIRKIAGLISIEIDKNAARIAEDHGPTFADASRLVFDAYVVGLNAVAEDMT